MSKKQSYITITDQFCGAGGSSQGAQNYGEKIGGGIEIKLALNHWALAIETHNTNFPNAIHDCTDISAADPRRYPSTDILITSPECTNHSLAKGVKIAKSQIDLFAQGKLDPAAERSRATMWDVPRFAEYHKYNIIIVENVVDARKWVMFDSWIHAMDSLGYNHKAVYLNSMHCHPTPQSRDRMYIVLWKKGNKAPMLEYTPNAHCPKCSKDVDSVQCWKDKRKNFGKYKQQYVYCCPTCSTIVEPYYYAAFNCIDWSDIGTKISDRKKPLSENTVRRINYGIKKYGNQPLQVVSYTPGYTKPLNEATACITTNDHHGLFTPPFLIDDKQTTGINFRVRSATDTVNIIHTDPRVKLVMPFIAKLEHSRADNVVPVNASMSTQTTRQSMALVTPPIITEMHGTSLARSGTRPLNTISAGGIHSGIVTTDSWNAFIHYNYGSDTLSHINQPLGVCTTKDRHSVISYKEPVLEDCHYRMLKPPEIKLAMAFDADYTVCGSGKWQVKQLGNAVTPPAMEWLVQQCVQSLS